MTQLKLNCLRDTIEAVSPAQVSGIEREINLIVVQEKKISQLYFMDF